MNEANLSLIHARYVGPISELKNKTALLYVSPDDSAFVRAQFDDMKLVHNGEALGFGWHAFRADEFERETK